LHLLFFGAFHLSYRDGGTFANPLSMVNVGRFTVAYCHFHLRAATVRTARRMPAAQEQVMANLHVRRTMVIAVLLIESIGFMGVALAQSGTAAPVSAPAPAPSPYSYADVADLATAAPVTVLATVRKTTQLPPERAPGVRGGHVRLFVEADVESLIRGSGALARRITYLVDVPVNAKGKPPKFKKARVLLFGRIAPGTTASIQLAAPDAQLSADAATEALARRILTEAVRPDAPPRITGIANGFHVSGTLPGDGETQLFLKTDTGTPVSLSIVRSGGTPPVWAAAFGEIVDESAAVPARDTLGWYRLACGLPRTVPDAVLVGTDGADRDAARADYAFVLAQLGVCPRTRTPPVL
jgi:hypothetical protein